MGTNRRYADKIDRQMDVKILDSIASKGGLQSLSAAEVALDREQLTIDPNPNPKPVKAWVRFYSVPVQVHAYAHRWTSRAVGIRFRAGGKDHTAWVWSSVVESGDQFQPAHDD